MASRRHFEGAAACAWRRMDSTHHYCVAIDYESTTAVELQSPLVHYKQERRRDGLRTDLCVWETAHFGYLVGHFIMSRRAGELRMERWQQLQWAALQVPHSREGIKLMDFNGVKTQVIGMTSFWQVSSDRPEE